MLADMIQCNLGLQAIPLPVGIIDDRHLGGKTCVATKYCGVVSVSPPIIYFSIDEAHPQKNALNGASLRFYLPSVVFFETFFGEKSQLSPFEVAEFFGSANLGINIIEMERHCHIQLDCAVFDSISIFNHQVFLCEVKHTFVARHCLSEGERNPHMDAIYPVVQASNHALWRIGKTVSDAFSVGNLYGGSFSGMAKHKLKRASKAAILSTYSRLLKIKHRGIYKRTDLNVKAEIPTRALIYPLPVILVGSYIDGRANFSVVANSGIISEDPSIVYISSHRSHCTNKGIIQNRFFSISIPNVGGVIKTDFCGIFSGNRVNKSSVFKCLPNHSANAPLTYECPATIECRLIHHYTLKRMDVFIGEVKKSYVSESCITNNHLDISKINPILYALNRKYWSIGSRL